MKLLIYTLKGNGKGPSMSDTTKDRSPYWLVCQSNTVYYTKYYHVHLFITNRVPYIKCFQMLW